MGRKKKGRSRNRGIAVNMSELLGPEHQANALPSAPSAKVESGMDGGRGRGRTDQPWQRGRVQDEPPSRADQSNSWRRVNQGPSSYGGSRGAYGSRGGGFETSRNRFDASQDARGWRGGSGSQDARWGGASQDSRVSGGRDTRPAHLRNRFRRDVVGGARANREWEKKQAEEQKAKEAAEAERAAEEKKAQTEALKAQKNARANTYSDNLRKVAVVSYKNARSPLETAIRDSTEIGADSLAESFKRFNLKKTPANEAGLVLANSMLSKKVPPAEFLSAVEEYIPAKETAAIIVGAVAKSLQSRSARTLRRVFDADEQKVILDFVNTESLEGDELDAYLTEQGLFFLKPLPQITDDVLELVNAAASADEVLSFIDSKLTASQVPHTLAVPVLSAILKTVVVSKTELDLSPIAKYAPVLLRCENDHESQKELCFAVQRALYKAGDLRRQTASILRALFDAQLVEFEGLDAWRDDRSKQNKKGKAAALSSANSFIVEVTPVEPEEEDEEEGDEEEEEIDEYLRNPNAEYF